MPLAWGTEVSGVIILEQLHSDSLELAGQLWKQYILPKHNLHEDNFQSGGVLLANTMKFTPLLWISVPYNNMCVHMTCTLSFWVLCLLSIQGIDSTDYGLWNSRYWKKKKNWKMLIFPFRMMHQWGGVVVLHLKMCACVFCPHIQHDAEVQCHCIQK